MAEHSEFRPDQILAVLAEHEVRFVLIGGLAAVLHGSAYPTFDVDVLPERSRENLTRLSDALRALDARIRVEGVPDGLPFNHDASSIAGMTTLNLVTSAGDLHIAMQPAGVPEYADWEREAVRITVLGTPVTVAALATVVRSKEAADRPKDRTVLPMLRALLDRADEDSPASP